MFVLYIFNCKTVFIWNKKKQEVKMERVFRQSELSRIYGTNQILANLIKFNCIQRMPSFEES